MKRVRGAACMLVLVCGVAGLVACGGPAPEPRTPAELQRACDEARMRACLNLADAYYDGKIVARDVDHAARLYDKACKGGRTLGCVNLGVMYAQGEGEPQDFATALGLFRTACERTPASDITGGAACVNVGYMLQHAYGAPADLEAAQQLYDRACDSGLARGCVAAGVLVWPRDHALGEARLTKACVAGIAPACTSATEAQAGKPPDLDLGLVFAKVVYDR